MHPYTPPQPDSWVIVYWCTRIHWPGYSFPDCLLIVHRRTLPVGRAAIQHVRTKGPAILQVRPETLDPKP